MPQKRTKKEPGRNGRADLPDSCFSKSICSSMDCTGLIPALPASEAELESYEEMYQFCLSCASPDAPSSTAGSAAEKTSDPAASRRDTDV